MPWVVSAVDEALNGMSTTDVTRSNMALTVSDEELRLKVRSTVTKPPAGTEQPRLSLHTTPALTMKEDGPGWVNGFPSELKLEHVARGKSEFALAHEAAQAKEKMKSAFCIVLKVKSMEDDIESENGGLVMAVVSKHGSMV